MFESRQRSGGSTNRWLIVAGAGLVILAFVARMLLDIGNTKVSDLAAAIRPDTTTAPAATTAPDTTTVSDTATVPAAAPDPAPVTAPVAAPVKVDTPIAPPSAPRPSVTSSSSSPPPGTRVVVADAPPILKLDTSRAGGAFAVQIGAFGSESNATQLSERASALGYSAVVVPQSRDGSTLYLVRVRGLTSAGEARQVSDALASKLGVKSVVLPPARQDR